MLHRNQDVFPAIFVRELGLHAYIHTLHTWQSAHSSSTRQTLFCFQDRLFFHQTDSFCLQDRFFCFYETQLSLPGCGTSRFAQSSSTPRRTMPREPAPVICFSHFSCFFMFTTKIIENRCENAVPKNVKKIMVWASILDPKIDENRRRNARKALKL